MTIRDALDWINAKGQEFGRAHDRIVRGRERAARWARTRERGSAEREAAGETVARWSKLLADHSAAMVRWQKIASRIPGLDGNLGLIPVVPIAMAGTVIAVALAMSVILRRVTAEERALALLESGRISPAEAIELAKNLEGGRSLMGGVGTGLGAVAPLLAAGAVAFFLMRR